ncbi:hypothetical protein OV079_06185 [Nannocystis pusilla]|uniref:Uncharacterized protein n=1 Tax=Nannocystis pusilla TaxID=889268 RepID=A0A9X3ER13_9BACT|nr:hypothetical protein [Nannocystis pusilla]MCY1005166.1 hypothetical protein [Nannocystis pusilla]
MARPGYLIATSPKGQHADFKHNIVAAITTLIMAVSGTSLMSGCNKQQTDTANPEPAAVAPAEPAPVDPALENPPPAEPAGDATAEPTDATTPPAEATPPTAETTPPTTNPPPPAPSELDVRAVPADMSLTPRVHGRALLVEMDGARTWPSGHVRFT